MPVGGVLRPAGGTARGLPGRLCRSGLSHGPAAGHLLAFTAKQLPGYGGNLETAASDLAHYQKMEFFLPGSLRLRRRAELLQTMLSDRGLSSFLAFPPRAMPRPGQILLAEGNLPSGMGIPP